MPPPTTVLLYALPGLLHDILGLRAHRVELGELSADALLAVIGPRAS